MGRLEIILKKFNRLQMSLCRNMTMDAKEVIIENKLDKGIIILNRPKALNAINLKMVRDIYKPLKQWETEKNLVIIKGVGEKSFCAGGDVRAIVENGPTELSKQFFREEYTLNALIGQYKIPYVALIDGITMGGGVGLSVHGKYRVATERTVFAMPETAIGLFPDVGGSYFLPQLQNNLGMFLGLTGYRLKGEDVYKAGIATHFCKSSELPSLEADLLNSKNRYDVENILDKYTSSKSKEFILASHLPKIERYFGVRNIEEIVKHLKEDDSTWFKNILKILCKMSPTSLKVTHKEINYGKNLSLEECLKMEYRMVVRHIQDSDFKEGVRALLIDKDQNPKWNPPTLEDVSEERVNSFFEPLPKDEELNVLSEIEKVKSQL